MNLWAISDLHLNHDENRAALASIGRRPNDWLILAGDIGESEADLGEAFSFLSRRFAKLIWAPGNHELWTASHVPGSPQAQRGLARYWSLIGLARSFGVLTPEDPYPVWPAGGRPIAIVPMFTLYDYSFRPEEIAAEDVADWAAAEDVIGADEFRLDASPYPDRSAWCAARVTITRARLDALPRDYGTVLVNHYPLERAHALLPRAPRFAPWCGTRLTEGWHRRFRAVAVVYGHLHIRRRFEHEGVIFHEVSLGYPGQWDENTTLDSYLRLIL